MRIRLTATPPSIDFPPLLVGRSSDLGSGDDSSAVRAGGLGGNFATKRVGIASWWTTPVEAEDLQAVDGQVAFSELKDSAPIRLGVAKGDLDSEGRMALVDLNTAGHRMRVVSNNDRDTAWGAFATNGDNAASVQAYTDISPSN